MSDLNTRSKIGFLLITFITVIISISPIVIFSYLKYNGLEDISLSESDVDLDDLAAGSVCGILIKTPINEILMRKDIASCIVVFCDKGLCAVKAEGSGEHYFLGDTSALKSSVDRLFNETFRDEGVNNNEQESKNSKKENSDSDNNEFHQAPYAYPLWQWLSIFSVAITFSILGASTSLYTKDSKRNVEILKYSIKGTFIFYFMTSIVGIIVVCLFAGGFIRGHLFPEFGGDEKNFGFNSWRALKFRAPDWFKLAIWAYIAGFYERFVPRIFDDLVKKAEDERSGDDRKKPPEANEVDQHS